MCVCECVQFVIQIEVWQWPNWRLMMSSFCALAGKPNVIAHCAGPVGPLLRCSVPQLAIWTRTTAAAHCNQSRTAKSGTGRRRWSRRRSVSGSRGNCLGRGKCKLRYDHNDQLAHVVIPTKINQASFKNWRKDEPKRLSNTGSQRSAKSPKSSDK